MEVTWEGPVCGPGREGGMDTREGGYGTRESPQEGVGLGWQREFSAMRERSGTTKVSLSWTLPYKIPP